MMFERNIMIMQQKKCKCFKEQLLLALTTIWKALGLPDMLAIMVELKQPLDQEP
jgi:hypothetical protein